MVSVTATQLPLLLGLAWLVPLVSFVAILFFGPKMGPHGRNAAWVATAAIGTSFVLSLTAFVVWLGAHPVVPVHHGDHGGSHASLFPGGTAHAAEEGDAAHGTEPHQGAHAAHG